ncbi:MAG: hypothetical protein ABJC74_04725 [Gemmatimonadota bacterium]
MSQTAPSTTPTAECDLIMKGGITSGVVYPPAILELKSKYRFRSIGGTSAGAIAAGLTAAAEFGRAANGFERLQEASAQLAQPGFLISLFRPTGGTGPLFRFALRLSVLLSGKRKGAFKAVTATHRGLFEATPIMYTIGVVLAASLGLAFAAGTAAFWTPQALAGALDRYGILSLFALNWLWTAIAIACLLFAITVLAPIPGLIRLLWILARTVPDNQLGICRGTRNRPSDKPAVTEWLHQQIQRCAGRDVDDPPLTFGELWAGPADWAVRGTAAKPSIDLRMITSCLSQHQPFVLPFSNEIFAMRDRDAELFFPPAVARWLADKAPPVQADVKLPAGFRYLPVGADLPVLVAVRMSLSFPVLFSAVPLYSLPLRAARPGAPPVTIPAEALQLNWFSDGGICSNFPIHFFDNWLPRRPTFGITLTSLPPESFVAGGRVSSDYMAMSRPSGQVPTGPPDDGTHTLFNDPVYLPRAGDEQAPEWVPLGDAQTGGRRHPDLFQFLGAIFTTAQNYRDNAQSLLPSYRERVIQIRLKDDEGGLNLNMPAATIQRIADHGRMAGAVLRDRFDFSEHQWVRYRVLLAELERNLGTMGSVVEADRAFWLGDLGKRAWCVEPALRYAYPRPEDWFKTASDRLAQLLSVSDSWGTTALFQEAPPAPRPALRVVPVG